MCCGLAPGRRQQAIRALTGHRLTNLLTEQVGQAFLICGGESWAVKARSLIDPEEAGKAQMFGLKSLRCTAWSMEM